MIILTLPFVLAMASPSPDKAKVLDPESLARARKDEEEEERKRREFVAISTTTTFYMLQFWAAGIIDMFIPSGGGQWAAQGAISIMAAQKMGVDPVKTSMMVAWGDQWTNMIQPFWALPLLGLAGLKARDIMGYSTLVLLWSGLILSVAALVAAL